VTYGDVNVDFAGIWVDRIGFIYLFKNQNIDKNNEQNANKVSEMLWRVKKGSELPLTRHPGKNYNV
jgi:hypothetical protein